MVANCSGVVPYMCMWRRAISANSAAVNMPYGATNSLFGRVHGAVDDRSVYTPAEPEAMSTTSETPVAICAAASMTAGTPSDEPDANERAEAELVGEVAARVRR